MVDQAMSDRSFRVVVTREDSSWLADVPELAGAHTDARSLPTLDRYVREVVVLAAGLPDDAEEGLELVWEFHTGDGRLDEELDQLRALRARVEAERAELEDETGGAARRLREGGFSVRDAAKLLGISPARVDQIVGG